MLYYNAVYSKMEYEQRGAFRMFSGKKQPRILIVDDDEGLRYCLSQALLQKGFAVETAANGRDALRKVAGFAPDVVILDLNMPVMNGPETRKRLKSDPKTQNIPVIFYSAACTDDIEKVKIDIDYYLKKPATLDTLLGKIREVTNLH